MHPVLLQQKDETAYCSCLKLGAGGLFLPRGILPGAERVATVVSETFRSAKEEPELGAQDTSAAKS